MSDFAIVTTGAQAITITRSVAAPVAAVVKAHMEPDLLMQWMGMPDIPLTTCEMDARVGGGFRYGWGLAGGDMMWVTGTFLEMHMAANGDSRTVHTELFDPDWTGGATTVETSYTTVGPGTVVQVTITYSSTAARDAAFASAMGDSMATCYTQLDALLAA